MTQPLLPPAPAPPAPPGAPPPPAGGGTGGSQPIATATIQATPIEGAGQPTPINVSGGSPAQTPPAAAPPPTWPGQPPPTQPPGQAPPPADGPPPGPAQTPPGTPPPGGQRLHPTRQAIIDAAQGEVGQVMDGGPGGSKQGWEHLQDYYEKAYGRPLNPQELGLVKGNGQRLNHWCGIFCVWACVKAGLGASWGIGTGPKGLGSYKTDKEFAPGDILVINNGFNHHCILKSKDGNTLTTIDGNQEAQSVKTRQRSAGDVQLYYHVMPEVYV